MSTSLKLWNPTCSKLAFPLSFRSGTSPFNLRLPSLRQYTLPPILSLQSPSQPSISSEDYIASVGSSPSPYSTFHLPLTQRHLLSLNLIACAAAISATWLFFSAIPALLAFKRAAQSLENLMDAAREELPDTMAAIRLSGMEISDLTMELTDIGQGLTQGVRSSTKVVRFAEERLRGFQDMAVVPPPDGGQSKE
ncbi:hypothetical protein M5689_013251 [Euphorbia peplus]|nr:hypothetical protein M5689_013251 [Euphorbia peplus]